MTAPDRDDLDRVLSLAESRYCLFCPQCGWDVSVDEDGCCENCGALAHGEAVETMQILRDKLIAVARAAAEEVMFDTGCDCIICTALSAITATNQQPCPGKFTAYLGEMQDAPCSLCGVKYVNHPTDSNQKEK